MQCIFKEESFLIRFVYILLTRDDEVEDYYLYKKKLRRMHHGLNIDELDKTMEEIVKAPNNRAPNNRLVSFSISYFLLDITRWCIEKM